MGGAAMRGQQTHVLVAAHLAVRAKCKPVLAVKRWRLAPTHPLQQLARLAPLVRVVCHPIGLCALLEGSFMAPPGLPRPSRTAQATLYCAPSVRVRGEMRPNIGQPVLFVPRH